MSLLDYVIQKSGQATLIALLRQWSFNVSGQDWFTPSRLRWCHMWAKIPVFSREISRDFSALSYAKNLGATWPATPLWGKLFMLPVGITHAKLLTEFEVCSQNNF